MEVKYFLQYKDILAKNIHICIMDCWLCISGHALPAYVEAFDTEVIVKAGWGELESSIYYMVAITALFIACIYVYIYLT